MDDQVWRFAARAGSRLRKIRRLKQMSVADLQIKSGIHKRTIQKFETGHQIVAWDTLRKLTDALNINPEQLFWPEGTKEVILNREITVDEAVRTIKSALRWQSKFSEVPLDIVNAVTFMKPAEIRQKLGLPTPEIDEKQFRIADPGAIERGYKLLGYRKEWLARREREAQRDPDGAE